MATPPDPSARARKRSARPMETPPAVPPEAPEWRRRGRLLILAAAVLLVLWLARSIIGPFVVAAVLAYAFSPVVSAAQNRTGLPRALIIGIGYVLFIGLTAGLAILAAERAGSELRELSSGGHDIIGSALHKLFGDTVTIAGQQIVVSDLAAQIRDALLGLFKSPSNAVEAAQRALDIALQVVLTLIITFYLLLDGHRFGQFALRFLDRPERADALRIGHRIHIVLGRWLRGQLLLVALVAAVIYLVLGPVLHVPYALAIAALSGVLEIVPLVGPLVAAGLAGTVAFASHGTNTAVVVLVAYLILRQVEDQIVMPLVIGRAVHLHPVVTIFAVLVGLSTWGVLGGLMGVPVAAALNVTLHELFPEETKNRAGEPPAPIEPAAGPRWQRFRRAAGYAVAPAPTADAGPSEAPPEGGTLGGSMSK